MKQETRDTLIFSGIILILTVLGVYLPLVSFFWPLPVVLFGLRNGVKRSIILVLLVSVLGLVFMHMQIFLSIILITGFIGIIMISAIYENYSGRKIFLITLGASVLSQALYLGVSQYVFAIDVFAALEMFIEGSLAGYEGVELGTVTDQIINILNMLFPTFVFISGALTAILNYYGLYYIAPKLALSLPAPYSFIHWRIPRFWLYAFIFAAIGASVFGGAILVNTAIILTQLFFAGGLSLVFWWLKDRVGPGVGTFFIIFMGIIIVFPTIGMITLSLFMVFVAPLMFFLGLADTGFNFRKLDTKEDE